jgi:chitodextrinase
LNRDIKVSNLAKRVRRMIKKTKQRWQNAPGRQKGIAALVFILLFAGIGSYLLFFAKAASITYTVPANIVSNCDPATSKNQGPAINAWLKSIPNGASATSPNIIQFGLNACYRLDSIIFAKHSNVIYDGNGSTFRRFNSQNFGTGEVPYPYDGLYNKGYPFWAVGASVNVGNDYVQRVNVTVRNMKIVGLNTVSDIDLTTYPGTRMYEPEKYGGRWTFGGYDAEFESALRFENIDGLVAENIETDAPWGDGVTVGIENPRDVVKNATLRNITIDRNGRSAVSIGTVDGLVMDNVKALHSRYSGFNIEVNGTGYTRNVEVKNSYINAILVAFSAGGSRPASDINIHHNTVRWATLTYPWVTSGNNPHSTAADRRSNWKVHNNTLLYSTENAAVWFVNTDNVEVYDNVMPVHSSPNVTSTARFPGVKLQNVGGTVNIKNNDFVGNDPTGTLYAQNYGVYSTDSLTTATVTACGNRTTPTVYNQPAACPTSTGDTTPPTTAITSHANGATVTGTFNLIASATDNTGVAKVEFYVDGVLKGSDADNTAPYTYAWDTKTTTNGSHTLMSKAYDTAGNSATSPAITVTVNNPTADTQPPTAPANLTATAVSSSQINLAWTASTDNVGVTGYDIYRNGAKIATVTTTSYGNTGLAPSTSYSYHVIARDATTNSSPQSNTATATTQSPPPPPSATSTLSGTVRSSTGAVLPGAKVSLTVNGSKRTLVTNSAGQYTATGLPAGTYQVKYSAQQHVAQALSVNVTSGTTTNKDVVLVRR